MRYEAQTVTVLKGTVELLKAKRAYYENRELTLVEAQWEVGEPRDHAHAARLYPKVTVKAGAVKPVAALGSRTAPAAPAAPGVRPPRAPQFPRTMKFSKKVGKNFVLKDDGA